MGAVLHLPRTADAMSAYSEQKWGGDENEAVRLQSTFNQEGKCVPNVRWVTTELRRETGVRQPGD